MEESKRLGRGNNSKTRNRQRDKTIADRAAERSTLNISLTSGASRGAEGNVSKTLRINIPTTQKLTNRKRDFNAVEEEKKEVPIRGKGESKSKSKTRERDREFQKAFNESRRRSQLVDESVSSGSVYERIDTKKLNILDVLGDANDDQDAQLEESFRDRIERQMRQKGGLGSKKSSKQRKIA